MKKKNIYLILVAAAAISLLINIMRLTFTGYFSSVMSFPLEQLGMTLRVLSLSGEAGNTLALLIYWAVGLLPVAGLVLISKRRRLVAEDNLLALLSVVLLVVLYQMINPGTIAAGFGLALELSAIKAMLGITVYSLLTVYAVMRLARLFSAGNTASLAKYLSALLLAMAVIFVYIAFGSFFGQMLESFAALKKSNSGNEHLLGPSYVFLVIQYIINALPYVLNMLVALAAMGLLKQLQADRYSTQAVEAAEKMSRLCVKVLTITVLCSALFNVLQLLFAQHLLVINNAINIPVVSIAYALAALLFARLVAENKQLKDDNDMFI